MIVLKIKDIVMTKREFAELHGFDEEDMERIDNLVRIFGGKIIEISEKKK